MESNGLGQMQLFLADCEGSWCHERPGLRGRASSAFGVHDNFQPKSSAQQDFCLLIWNLKFNCQKFLNPNKPGTRRHAVARQAHQCSLLLRLPPQRHLALAMTCYSRSINLNQARMKTCFHQVCVASCARSFWLLISFDPA